MLKPLASLLAAYSQMLNYVREENSAKEKVTSSAN